MPGRDDGQQLVTSTRELTHRVETAGQEQSGSPGNLRQIRNENEQNFMSDRDESRDEDKYGEIHYSCVQQLENDD